MRFLRTHPRPRSHSVRLRRSFPFSALLPTASINLGQFNLRLDNALMLAAGGLAIVGLQLLLNRTKLGLLFR
jgi:branched-chain amino acid transport system permease protein